MSSLVAASAVIAGLAFGARAGIRAYQTVAASRTTSSPSTQSSSSHQPPADSWMSAFVYHLKNPSAGPTGGAFPPGGFEDKMDRSEAAKILNLPENASKDKIMKNYKKLLLKNHPDRGGSTHIATKINEAKDQLLAGRS